MCNAINTYNFSWYEGKIWYFQIVKEKENVHRYMIESFPYKALLTFP